MLLKLKCIMILSMLEFIHVNCALPNKSLVWNICNFMREILFKIRDS
jgi:hypothetical protein